MAPGTRVYSLGSGAYYTLTPHCTRSTTFRDYLLEARPSEFVLMTSYYPPISSSRALQQLFSLDKASPQFHERLIDFFRGSAYQHIFQTLQNESLTMLVEYLDSVRLKIPPLHLMFDIALAPRQRSRPCRPRIPGIFASTPRDMRLQEGVTDIVYAFRITPGVCVPGNIQWLQGAHQTREDEPRERPRKGQGCAFMVLHLTVLKSSQIG